MLQMSNLTHTLMQALTLLLYVNEIVKAQHYRHLKTAVLRMPTHFRAFDLSDLSCEQNPMNKSQQPVTSFIFRHLKAKNQRILKLYQI